MIYLVHFVVFKPYIVISTTLIVINIPLLKNLSTLQYNKTTFEPTGPRVVFPFKAAWLLLSVLYRGHSVGLLKHSVKVLYIFVSDFKSNVFNRLSGVLKEGLGSL